MNGPVMAISKKCQLDFHLSGNRMALVDPLVLPFAKFDTNYQNNYSRIGSCLSGCSSISSNYLPQIIPQSNAIPNQEEQLDKSKSTPTLFELQSSGNNSSIVEQKHDSSILSRVSRYNHQYQGSNSSPTSSKPSLYIKLSEISQESESCSSPSSIKDENLPVCLSQDAKCDNPQTKSQEEHSDASSLNNSQKTRGITVKKKKNKNRRKSAKRKSRLKQVTELKQVDPHKDKSDISLFEALCKPIIFTNSRLNKEIKKPVLKSTLLVYQNTNQHNNPGPVLSKSVESGVQRTKTTFPATGGNASKRPGKVPQSAPVSASHNSPLWSDFAAKEHLKEHSSGPGRVTKVYLSEKRSKSISEKGTGTEFPGAPPATPMPDMLKRYEYVPSLCDVRSQRAVKVRLEHIEKNEQKKKAKEKEEKMKKEKTELKEKEQKLKKQQRREIYALNKKMTEFENNNFVEFCKAHDISLNL